MVWIRLHVEQRDSGGRSDGVGNGLDHILSSAFTEVWDAFYELQASLAKGDFVSGLKV
jgi:hypothetical protein